MDGDRRLSELIRSVAERDGHKVWIAESVERALDLGQRHEPEVILGALELGREDGAVPLRTLRDTLPKTPAIILTSASRTRYDPHVQSVMDALQAREFLKQPLSVLDLMDSLRRLAASTAATSPKPLVTAPVAVKGKNLIQLARIWANRLSGQLLFVDGARNRRTLSIFAGGPAGPGQMRALQQSLQEGSLEFERQALRGQGLHAELGTLLWGAAVGATPPATFLSSRMYQSLVITAPAETVSMLGLSALTQSVLAQADGAILLGQLIAACPPKQVDAIAGELHALERMRLVAFQSPVSRGRAPSEQSGSNPNSRASRPSRIRRTRATPSRATRSRSVSRARGSTVADSTMITGSRHSVSRSTKHRAQMSPKQIKRMIAYDIERMPASTPSSILLIQPDAPPAERKHAARRLARRYKSFSENRSISDEDRRHARHLLQIIRDAYRRLSAGDNSPLKTQERITIPSTPEALLFEGMRRILRREWSEADKVLTRAQALRAGDSVIMAHLGWARLHNPGLDRESRERDGAAQIALAYQFSPNNADICYFLAAQQLMVGHHDVVRQIIAQCQRQHPDDERFEELERNLQDTVVAD